ncbi:MAG: hypothetical protein DCF26_10010 [Burkholderiales bacterium]|nr:MAG: hypothetical protein DCF26_10010 [Burkholderiales bacterium]
MFNPADLFELPKSIVLAVLRFLWWLGWDFLVETVFWSVGWLTVRVLSLGRFPQEQFTQQDDASGFTSLFLHVTGAVVLWALIWFLSR